MKYILNHKDKPPYSTLPCTKLGAGDSLLGTKMGIMTNKKRKTSPCSLLIHHQDYPGLTGRRQ